MGVGQQRLRVLWGITVALGLGGCADIGLGNLIGDSTGGNSRTASLIRMGDYALAHGDQSTAIALYEQVLAVDPGSQEALERLGRTHQHLGATANAIDGYRAAVDRDPNDPVALRRLGNALIAEAYPEQAMPYLQQSLSLEETPQTRNSLGVALDLLGQHRLAQQNYRGGIAGAPGDIDLANNLGLSLALSGDFESAIGLASEVSRSDFATSYHRQTFALVLGLAGRTDEAAAMASRDLSQDEVASSLDYYELLRSIDSSSARALAITTGMADLQVGIFVESVDADMLVLVAAVPH